MIYQSIKNKIVANIITDEFELNSTQLILANNVQNYQDTDINNMLSEKLNPNNNMHIIPRGSIELDALYLATKSASLVYAGLLGCIITIVMTYEDIIDEYQKVNSWSNLTGKDFLPLYSMTITLTGALLEITEILNHIIDNSHSNIGDIGMICVGIGSILRACSSQYNIPKDTTLDIVSGLTMGIGCLVSSSLSLNGITLENKDKSPDSHIAIYSFIALIILGLILDIISRVKDTSNIKSFNIFKSTGQVALDLTYKPLKKLPYSIYQMFIVLIENNSSQEKLHNKSL